MTEACATCGADDELLFTCRHCGRRFCERHELPHHACERFQGGRTPSETTDTPAAEAESSRAVEEIGAAGEPPVRDVPTQAAPATETLAAPAAEQPTDAAPREAPVRPMDTQRAVGVVSSASTPQSLGEWLARQTYLTLLFKVGSIALLINAAFYGGVALTLYDPFGLL